MSRTLQIVIGVIAAVLALVAGIYGRSMYLKEVSTYTVPVPVSDIQPYTVLDSSMFQMKEMPRAFASLAYYQTAEDMNGKIATAMLPGGLPVAMAMAVPAAEFRLADPSLEVISFPVEPVSAVGGQIHIGDRINIYRMVIDTDKPSDGNQPNYIIEQIATSTLVVDVRSMAGAPAAARTKDGETGSMSGQNQQSEQTQILTVAVDPSLTVAILDTITSAKKRGGMLWTSLAVP